MLLFFLGVMPVHFAIEVDAGRQLAGEVDVTEAAGDPQAEMVFSNRFWCEQAAQAHVFPIPLAVQVAGIVGYGFGHTWDLSMNSSQ